MKTVKMQAILVFILCVFMNLSVSAQVTTINGKVNDAQNGNPVPHVKITIAGTLQMFYSNQEGKFQLQASMGDKLCFLREGYQPDTVIVNSNQIEVLLKRNYRNLAEALNKAEVMNNMDGEIISVRGNRSDGQQVIVDGVRLRSVSLNKKQKHYAVQAAINREDYFTSNESYESFGENRFKTVSKEPLSTFSLDVDAASYSNVRRMINQGVMPPSDAVRVEEMINYFDYQYETPSGNAPIAIHSELTTCPWNTKHYLVKVGVKAKDIPTKELPASNFVFLIDVSGSMYGPTRLDLVKSSMKLLVNNLREEDRVAIVVYAGAAGQVLPSTSGSDKAKIMEAINNLTAGGSTAGGAGIKLAYQIAENNFIKDGNNRIVLCTDGDFNVGVSDNKELEKMIETKRQSGVFLTVLGYGMGNYKDSKMQVLAQKGNGNHAYIDNLQEANKVLVNEFGGTMHTVAKDVKIQIEFNPGNVTQYRLIGYESRLLQDEDFNDDIKDAGELGAGHTVTALYEIIPSGVESSFNQIDPLKYQQTEIQKVPAETVHSDELLTVKLRYQGLDGGSSKKIEKTVMIKDAQKAPSTDFQFIMSAALFGQLLKKSPFVTKANYADVIELANKGTGNDPNGYRKEFVRLVKTVEQLGK